MPHPLTSPRRRAAGLGAAALVATLALAACGSTSSSTTSQASGGATSSATPSDGASTAADQGVHAPANKAADLALLDSVKVTDNGSGKAPTVALTTKPLRVSQTAVKVLKPGTGAKSDAKSKVTITEALYLGSSGKELDSTYGKPAQSFTLADNNTIPGLRIALDGVQAGSRILAGISAADAFGATGNSQAGIAANETLLLVADVVAVGTPLTEAKGTAVAPVAGLPTVTFASGKGPTITVPKTAAPTTLVSQLLVEGTGATVKAGQNLTVQYTGATWADGKVFDSSWTKGSPFSFPVGQGQVIKGWDTGLVGKKVGSRVLLVVPPAQGYGAQAQGSIPANSTLVFVVDVLDAS
ncbi:FKBP-type peptidyl-prolyl cis-trans isomerase [Lapillicoccus jejuensis]|uniref:peptidylprolyl isomerase n=1 Tax=Lapillicoccus jejuensis TaxID=402171 RepID=A0A542E4R9_9MICO|nr:FKBP-type peptidyl-prolyl cis-trans isomerase [Lapillicoccus jejuensis]TQJ10317.1 peptidylprolyl isomerase [Lapillicoccus jejuensis]